MRVSVEKMNLLYLTFSVLLFIISAQNVFSDSDLLVPNYDNLEHKLKGFDIRRPLVLHCNITKDQGELELLWKKDGIQVEKIEELKNRYTIIEAEKKFVIPSTIETDAGLYSCRLGESEKEIKVLADVAVRTPSNIIVTEYEDLLIECEVVGSAPRIHWEINNSKIDNSTERYKLDSNSNGVKNAVLKVLNVTLEDRGSYSCVATNTLTELKISSEAGFTTFVRVKDHMAAVWPAVGILAQVLFLGVITIFARKADSKMVFED